MHFSGNGLRAKVFTWLITVASCLTLATGTACSSLRPTKEMRQDSAASNAPSESYVEKGSMNGEILVSSSAQSNTPSSSANASDKSDGNQTSAPIDCVAAIEDKAGESVVWSNVADYNADGKEEAFALVGGEQYGTAVANSSEAWLKPSLWFASSDGTATLLESFDRIVYVNGVLKDPAGSGYSLLSLEVSGGGSGTNSRVYGVRDGLAKELAVEGGNVRELNGMLVMSCSYFKTGGGHRLEWYELSFNPESFALKAGSIVGDTSIGELP